MTEASIRHLRQRLKAYSNLCIPLNLACKNIGISLKVIERIAAAEKWTHELDDMFQITAGQKRKAPAKHEGIRYLKVETLESLAPELNKRLIVRFLTARWTRRTIKKKVMLHVPKTRKQASSRPGIGQSNDGHHGSAARL